MTGVSQARFRQNNVASFLPPFSHLLEIASTHKYAHTLSSLTHRDSLLGYKGGLHCGQKTPASIIRPQQPPKAGGGTAGIKGRLRLKRHPQVQGHMRCPASSAGETVAVAQGESADTTRAPAPWCEPHLQGPRRCLAVHALRAHPQRPFPTLPAAAPPLRACFAHAQALAPKRFLGLPYFPHGACCCSCRHCPVLVFSDQLQRGSSPPPHFHWAWLFPRSTFSNKRKRKRRRRRCAVAGDSGAAAVDAFVVAP